MEDSGPIGFAAPLMRYTATIGGSEHDVDVEELAAHKLRLAFGGQKFDVDLRETGTGSLSVIIGNRAFDFDVVRDGDQTVVAWRDGSLRINLADRARRQLAARASRSVSGRIEIKAMMPGRVVQVLLKAGDEVTKDQGVVVVEAMKMENELKSPKAGKIVEIRVAPGQTVEKGDILAVIE